MSLAEPREDNPPKKVRMLAFTRYGRQAASTRQRLLQYLPHLVAAGIEVEWRALLDNDYVRSLASGDHYPRRRIARAYLDRLGQLVTRRSNDLIWIYGELFPYLPAGLERLFTAGKRVIYDFDDAFFHDYEDVPNRLARSLLDGKHGALLRNASACVCGNTYLHDYAARFCPNSFIVPTVVDTDSYRPVLRTDEGPIIIGWIGSPTTWHNVQPLLPQLKELCSNGMVRVRAVGAGKMAERDYFPGLDLIEWTEEDEVAEVQRMDIGIMPLVDSPFERGKSGYKLIQYMACGLPVIASPVGVNREIVAEGESGFLATSEGDWNQALRLLTADAALREGLGRAGRRRVERCYSLSSQSPRLIEILRSAIR